MRLSPPPPFIVAVVVCGGGCSVEVALIGREVAFELAPLLLGAMFVPCGFWEWLGRVDDVVAAALLLLLKVVGLLIRTGADMTEPANS